MLGGGRTEMRRSALAGFGFALGLSFTAVAEDVQTLANRWSEAYNRHDNAALGALYTEDARLYLHGAPTHRGRESIQAYWAEDMQAGNPLTVLTVTHAVDGADMKLVHGDYQVVHRITGALVGSGRFAHIWTLDEDGQWRLDRDLWNEPYTPYTPEE
jgi:uncharacterized protein (TIGR02246 family)